MIVDLGKMRILVLNEQVKKIRITCRCKHVNVYQIPEPLAVADIMIVVSCDECRQNFGYVQGKITRLDQELNPEAPLIRKAVKRPTPQPEHEVLWEMPVNSDIN